MLVVLTRSALNPLITVCTLVYLIPDLLTKQIPETQLTWYNFDPGWTYSKVPVCSPAYDFYTGWNSGHLRFLLFFLCFLSFFRFFLYELKTLHLSVQDLVPSLVSSWLMSPVSSLGAGPHPVWWLLLFSSWFLHPSSDFFLLSSHLNDTLSQFIIPVLVVSWSESIPHQTQLSTETETSTFPPCSISPCLSFKTTNSTFHCLHSPESSPGWSYLSWPSRFFTHLSQFFCCDEVAGGVCFSLGLAPP